MKTPVTIRVPIDESWDAGTRIQVFTDAGTGTVDENNPLLARARDVFPAGRRSEGYGLQPYGLGGYGLNTPDPKRSGGFGEPVYEEGPYGDSQARVELTVKIPPAFGKWIFAVKTVDAQGNVQTDPALQISRIVSATEPPTVTDLAFVSYDAVNDRVTLSFTRNTE